MVLCDLNINKCLQRQIFFLLWVNKHFTQYLKKTHISVFKLRKKPFFVWTVSDDYPPYPHSSCAKASSSLTLNGFRLATVFFTSHHLNLGTWVMIVKNRNKYLVTIHWLFFTDSYYLSLCLSPFLTLFIYGVSSEGCQVINSLVALWLFNLN